MGLPEGIAQGQSGVANSDPGVPPGGQDPGQGGKGEGGEGGQLQQESEVKDYAGFKTPDELIADYQTKVKSFEELHSRFGKQGNELGTLRTEHAKLMGRLEALEAMRSAPAGPRETLDDLDQKLTKGDINFSQYIAKRDEIKAAEIERKIEEKVQGFQSTIEKQRYIDNFIKDNPGYVEAYNDGRLSQWINQGMSGEEAWAAHKWTQANTENSTLKTQVVELTKQLQGLQAKLGGKLEEGKAPAGKVLGAGGGGSFGASSGQPKTFKNHSEQVAAGVALLERIK